MNLQYYSFCLLINAEGFVSIERHSLHQKGAIKRSWLAEIKELHFQNVETQFIYNINRKKEVPRR